MSLRILTALGLIRRSTWIGTEQALVAMFMAGCGVVLGAEAGAALRSLGDAFEGPYSSGPGAFSPGLELGAIGAFETAAVGVGDSLLD